MLEGLVTNPGTLSLVSSVPLSGKRQSRLSVPRNSPPAAVLADWTAVRISGSKSLVDACRAYTSAAANAATTEQIITNLTRWDFISTPPCYSIHVSLYDYRISIQSHCWR